MAARPTKRPTRKAASGVNPYQQAMMRLLMSHPAFRGNDPPPTTTHNQYRQIEDPGYMPSYDRGHPSMRPPPLGQVQMNFSSTPSPTVRGWGNHNGYMIRDWDNQLIGTAPSPVNEITSNTPYDDIIERLKLAGIRWADDEAPNTQLRQYMR